MGAKNKVIAGKYLNEYIFSNFGITTIGKLTINKSIVSSYEIVDEQSQKSASSAIGRGALGAVILGPIGLLAGLSAKSKGVHTLILHYTDGEKSLIEVNDKTYKNIMKMLF